MWRIFFKGQRAVFWPKWTDRKQSVCGWLRKSTKRKYCIFIVSFLKPYPNKWAWKSSTNDVTNFLNPPFCPSLNQNFMVLVRRNIICFPSEYDVIKERQIVRQWCHIRTPLLIVRMWSHTETRGSRTRGSTPSTPWASSLASFLQFFGQSKFVNLNID